MRLVLVSDILYNKISYPQAHLVLFFIKNTSGLYRALVEHKTVFTNNITLPANGKSSVNFHLRHPNGGLRK